MNGNGLDGARVLDGIRVLVVEGEFLIAMDVEQTCREHGARDVAILGSAADADGVALDGFDVAVLDTVADADASLRLAGRLRSSRVPVVFASAHRAEGGVGFAGTPVIGKPFVERELVRILAAALVTDA